MAFNMQRYMTRGVVRVVTDSLRATAKNEKESAFMKTFAAASRQASGKRYKAERQGEHIPPFLIASITSACNLHCAGCYSRSNDACCDSAPVYQLTAEEWDKLFAEADDLGISFILLAGGEPLLRYDVLKKAATHKNILFPVFTNGTYLHEKYLDVLDENRTVTVTTENIDEVYSDAFLDNLYALGCKAVIFVEFVPVTEESTHLAPTEKEQAFMHREVKRLRRRKRGMVFISFPGDEKSSGGCVAAGRGFFHINSHGGAEPCPFSPYSDINVRDTSLREALRSPLFQALQTQGLLQDDHVGGCTLYMHRDEVEAILGAE